MADHFCRKPVGIMTSVFSIIIVWISICSDLLLAQHQISVSGQVKSSVLLPCKLRVISERPYIRWSSSKDVFERSGNEWFQGQGYEGRADIPEDRLREGDCSLELRNLTLADTGVYKSYQVVRRVKRAAVVREKWELINSVELSVDDAAGINWSNPLLVSLSLLNCFIFRMVYRET
ncbi:hypothetical protein Baya_14494 [Bagarius yarrelli]|uniref:Immunoglobulin V-set domain-containing protein n=1 Tax=Bagarius yarrelli TaxID=175774 RepID=A0A556V903_BAGYA|nr:hypothetical protein Baya_14494 [Bagarius yarrelli]